MRGCMYGLTSVCVCARAQRYLCVANAKIFMQFLVCAYIYVNARACLHVQVCSHKRAVPDASI